MTKNKDQLESKPSENKARTFKAGLMPIENTGIVPLDIISKGIIYTDNALGLGGDKSLFKPK